MTTTIVTHSSINQQSVAFQFGARDAATGEPCVPEMIFLARQQQVEYCQGYESVAGVSATTAQFTGSAPQMAPPKPVAHRNRWSDFNAQRAISQVSAHLSFIEACYERTARETPQLAGELLWLPS